MRRAPFWHCIGVSLAYTRTELAALFGAAGLRIAAWRSFHATPYADHLVVDAYTYWDQTQALLAGKDPFVEGFYQPPGYPYLLAAALRLGGMAVEPDSARLINVVLGWVTTALVLRIGRIAGERVFGRPGLGALAALVYTLYPTTLLFELDLLTPAVTNWMLAAALLLPLETRGPAWLRLGLSGLILGAAAMVHPTVLLAAPAWLAAVWLGGGGRGAAIWLLGLALGVSPTATQNWTRWGQLALVSHNAGINLWLGNNPDWRDTAFARAGLEFRQLVLDAEPAERDTFARDRFWRQRLRSEIAEDPAALLRALSTKAVWSLSDVEIPRNEDYRCRTREGPMRWIGWLPARYGVVFPLAILGAAVLLCRVRKSTLALLPLGWACLHLVPILFLVADRYRLATWPFVAVCAALGVGALRERLRAGGRPGPAWLALPLVAALPWLPIDRATSIRVGWCAHILGNFALEDKDYTKAEALYREALDWEPDSIGAWHWLGVTLAAQGRHAEAVDAFDRALRDFPGSYGTLLAVSSSLRALNRHAEEAERLGQACAIPGPRANVCARYLRALVESGQRGRAREVLAAHPELAEHEGVKKLGLSP